MILYILSDFIKYFLILFLISFLEWFNCISRHVIFSNCVTHILYLTLVTFTFIIITINMNLTIAHLMQICQLVDKTIATVSKLCNYSEPYNFRYRKGTVIKIEKQLDFRIQRTYKTLQNALISLLNEKSFDDITVSELCEKAMIRRATFYKHFGDKYELFTFSIRELQEQFKEKNSLEYDTEDPKTFYVNMFDYSLQLVEQYNDIFKSMMSGSSSQMLFDILSNEIESDICEHLRQDVKNGTVIPAIPELIATMLTGSLVYTMKWWVMHEHSISRQELVQVCTSLIKFT